MNLVFFLLRASKARVVLSVLFGVLSGVGSTAMLAVINSSLAGNLSPVGNNVWKYALACAGVLFAGTASQLLLVHLAQGTIQDLHIRLSRQILSAPLSQLESIGPSRLLAILIEDVLVIINVINVMPVMCINGALIAGCLIYLGSLSGVALLLFLLFSTAGVLSYFLLNRCAVASLRQAREYKDEMFKNFRALVEGTKELKLHRRRREAFVSDVLIGGASQLRRHSITGISLYITASTWSKLMLFIYIGLLLFVLPPLQYINPATAISCVLLTLFVIGAIEGFVSTVPLLGQGNIALQKIRKMGLSLTSLENESKPGREVSTLTRSWHSLEVIDVVHSYRSDRDDKGFTLGPVSLQIVPGETVFLIGGNGSGKTTFIKILTGLYVPEHGAIRLDGCVIDDASREPYRENFSAVFSDFYLFESFLGLHNAELDMQAGEYLVQLQLDHKVTINGGRFSTTDLSHGQRKRLALLTAYLEDRSFYVFDEWAADQDPLFKEVFYKLLLPDLKKRGKTCFVVTHDDRYFHTADRLLRLDCGKLIGEQRKFQPTGTTPYTNHSRSAFDA